MIDPLLLVLVLESDSIVDMEQIPTNKIEGKEEIMNTIIRVDRSVRPGYPDFLLKVMDPELESAGPAEYDLVNVELWLHDNQKGGKWITLGEIYNYLKSNDLLKSCLGLADGIEIQKRGLATFRSLLGNSGKIKSVNLWRSVIEGLGVDQTSNFYVPYLFELDDKIILDWSCLKNGVKGGVAALRFPS